MPVLESTEPMELPEEMSWRYRRIPAGMMQGPYMIGAPHLGFESHHPVKRTVPCYKFLKGCTLACPFCRWKRQYTTYLPLLDLREPKFFRIVVAGGKKTFQDLRNAKVGDVVSLTRGPGAKETIRIRAWPELLEKREEDKWKKRTMSDISQYYFHLWQMRELTEHFGFKYYPSLRAVENSSTHPQTNTEFGDVLPP